MILSTHQFPTVTVTSILVFAPRQRRIHSSCKCQYFNPDFKFSRVEDARPFVIATLIVLDSQGASSYYRA